VGDTVPALGVGVSNGETVYVRIPKNASSSHREALRWPQFSFIDQSTPLEAYIPIRDPYTRYFAGVRTYAGRISRPAKYGAPGPYQDLLAEVRAGGWPVFDEHTMPQYEYILSTLAGPRTLVKVDHCTSYVKDRWQIELPRLAHYDYEIDKKLFPLIRDFYAEDFDLYDQAL
jgi:hypothetical protein